MKKLISVVLCLFIILSLGGCKGDQKTSGGGKDTPDSKKSDTTITLLYSKTDGFNPYTAKSAENRQLCFLLFDPLINLKNDFTPEYCIASSAESTGTECTVHLRQISFSDGSPLTAEDVIYSFYLAKGSTTSGYAVTLSEITDVVAADSYTLVFRTAYFDPYILNLLTFPIVKLNTAGQTDSDGVDIAPVGSGKYTVNTENSTLERNENYFGSRSQIKTVKLLIAPDSESISHHIEVGSADLYYTDAAAGKIVRMSGKRCEVNINRLIYIGVNSTYENLASREMRYAISSAIDRTEITKDAYYGAATPATSYFNPSLAEAAPTASLEKNANTQISLENLSKLGYNSKDEFGYYVNSSGKRLSYTLLVNSDNVSRLSAARLIAAECKNAGIEIIINEESYERYLSRLYSGNFQLYIGEVQVSPNMDMAPLVTPGGSAAFGVTEDVWSGGQMSVTQAIAAYRSGQIGITDLSGVMLTAMPQIPVCYRNGMLFYSNRIKSGVEGLAYNIYYNIQNYKF